MTNEYIVAENARPQYARIGTITRATSELYLPPRRITPTDACVKWLRNDKGAFDLSISPMMNEPLNHIGKREYQGIVFVGPARSSKTYALVLGGILYCVTSAPGDMLVIQMSGEAARDFSRGDLDRTIRHSDVLHTRLSTRARDDNTFDKFWRSGVSLKIGWPAVSQLSSKTLQYVWITDYDRPENRDNVDGEGPMWDLAVKRIETYMSRGKCIVESSPGEEMRDPQWRAITPHEAPPVAGIMSLYNRGTRARWYWPCLHCGVFFEAKPGLDLFGLPPLDDIIKLVKSHDPTSLADRYATVICKACGGIHRMEQRSEMNLRGMWVHEGERIEGDGTDAAVVGQRRRSSIASYWLGGVAATYQRWDALLQRYFQSVLTYARNGDEQALKATTMMDQGVPFMSPNLARYRGPEALLGRLEKWEQGTVPTGVRFLTAAVDVQSNRFVVQVHGWGVGLECYLIDRFNISTSGTRMESADRSAALDPAAFVEDWTVLIDQVVKKTYPVLGYDVRMPVRLVACDSGGKAGVTSRAYAFWRRLRAMSLHSRFALVKGDPRLNVPRVHQTFPDTSGRKDRTVIVRGDVPVWLINVNVMKDGVSGDLARDVVGPGYCHLPDWLPHDWFDEITAETKDEEGRWSTATNGVRNEAFDLFVYNRAACVMLNAEKINWERPPEWARPLQEQANANTGRSAAIADLARKLNG